MLSEVNNDKRGGEMTKKEKGGQLVKQKPKKEGRPEALEKLCLLIQIIHRLLEFPPIKST